MVRRMVVNTPLRRWLADNHFTAAGLARALSVQRGRVQFWVNGAACPRGPMLDLLIKVTGLTVTDLLRDPKQVRLREAALKFKKGVRKRSPKRMDLRAADAALAELVKAHAQPANRRRAS